MEPGRIADGSGAIISPIWLGATLGVILAAAAWPLGSNRYLALHLLCVAIGAVLIAAFCLSDRTLRTSKAAVRENGHIALLALPVIIWAFVQSMVEVPTDLAHPAWSIAAAALGEPSSGYIALDRSRSIFEATKLLLAAAAFVCALLIGRNRTAATVMFAAIGLTAAAVSVYGIVLEGLRLPHAFLIGWEGPFPYAGGRATGTFVSPNHFAAFASIGALVCLAMLTSRTGEVVIERGARVMVRTFLAFVFGRNAFWAVGFVLCLGAVLASGSRAAGLSLAFAAGLLALLTGFAARRGRRLVPVLFGAFILGLAAVTVAIGGGLTGDRLDLLAAQGDPLRLQMWRAAWDGIAASPWVGYGLGGFQPFFDTTAKLAWPMTVDYVHSDWLELAFSLGVPGALMWWSVFLMILGRLVHGLRVRQRDHHFLCAAVAIMAFTGLHAAFDSSLSIPAIACAFAVVLGTAVAQSAPSGNRNRS